MLTALGSTESKLSGFDAGADDYLIKPFEFRELVARLRALNRRRSTILSNATVLKIAEKKQALMTLTDFAVRVIFWWAASSRVRR